MLHPYFLEPIKSLTRGKVQGLKKAGLLEATFHLARNRSHLEQLYQCLEGTQCWGPTSSLVFAKHKNPGLVRMESFLPTVGESFCEVKKILPFFCFYSYLKFLYIEGFCE
jgi:hypothetical protein